MLIVPSELANISKPGWTTYAQQVEEKIANVITFYTGRQLKTLTKGYFPEYDWIDTQNNTWELKCSIHTDCLLEIASETQPHRLKYRDKTIQFGKFQMWRSAFGLCTADFIVFLTYQNGCGKLRIYKGDDIRNWIKRQQNTRAPEKLYGDKWGYKFNPQELDEAKILTHFWCADFETKMSDGKIGFDLSSPIKQQGTGAIGLKKLFEKWIK